MKNLELMGVQEMNVQEKRDDNGGTWGVCGEVALIEFVCGFIAGWEDNKYKK